MKTYKQEKQHINHCIDKAEDKIEDSLEKLDRKNEYKYLQGALVFKRK